MPDTQKEKRFSKKTVRNLAVFLILSKFWLAIDMITKRYFDSGYEVGEVISEPFFGIFQFLLVHNTGAAWGMFDQSTKILALISFVVCALILIAFVAYYAKHASLLETIGIALLFAGGLGNAIDRVVFGYVVDFINLTFINFPVFNIADIGVSGGVFIFLLATVLVWVREDKELKAASENQNDSNDLVVDKDLEASKSSEKSVLDEA